MTEDREAFRASLSITLRGMVALFVQCMLAAAFLAPAAVLGYQAVYWLRHGQWHGLTLWDGLAFLGIDVVVPPPGEAWEGVVKIVLYLLGMPLSLWLFIAFMLPLWLAAMVYAVWTNRRGQ